MAFSLEIHKIDNIFILNLNGRFDWCNGPFVAQWMKDIADHFQSALVVVNLADVNHIDFPAIASIISGMKHLRANNGDLYICGTPPTVYNKFLLIGLERVITIFADEGEAINALTSGISIGLKMGSELVAA